MKNGGRRDTVFLIIRVDDRPADIRGWEIGRAVIPYESVLALFMDGSAMSQAPIGVIDRLDAVFSSFTEDLPAGIGFLGEERSTTNKGNMSGLDIGLLLFDLIGPNWYDFW